MGLEVNIGAGEAGRSMVTIDQRVYVNADRDRVVAEGSAEAAFLLATPGTEIPEVEAVRLGLVKAKRAAKPKTKAGEE